MNIVTDPTPLPQPPAGPWHPLPSKAWAYGAATLAALLVILVYVWFVSVGYWTWWPKTTYTYDLLGSAFRSGQVSLQEMPDPALLALPNPYDPAARAGIQYPWDASFFAGRYYLYWGPTPGVLLAVVKLFYSGQIADQYLVFAFVLGVFIFGLLLLLAVWRRFFRLDIPAGALFLSFLALGLAGPATWLLNRPAGYEAAIAGGQFFFITGLYFAVSAQLHDLPSNGKLLVAGTCWAFAVGSRAAVALPVAAMTLVIVVRTVRDSRPGSAAVRSVAALVAPLMLGAAALAWYNWARFGSVIEFGLRYQLTMIDLNAAYGGAFSVHYIADNLHNYLLNPVAIGRTFPFATPLLPQRLPAGPALSVPAAEIEPVSGMLISSPFVVYGLLTIVALLGKRRADSPAGSRAGGLAQEVSPYWLYLGLLMCAAFSSAFLLLYFYPTMRQLEDVVPILSILAVLGFWEGWRYLSRRPLVLTLYGLTALVLILVSILVSCLLAVTSYENRFQHLNRDLLRELIRFFGR